MSNDAFSWRPDSAVYQLYESCKSLTEMVDLCNFRLDNVAASSQRCFVRRQ